MPDQHPPARRTTGRSTTPMNTLIRLWQQLANAGQCSVCSGWFDNWPGGVCAACIATGRN